LQFRLDDTGDAHGHLVLEVEDIFQLALETIGPQMRAGIRVNQLSRDADAIAALTYRTLEHVTHTQFPTNPFHVYCLALVGEGRIAGDYEQPTDAGQRGDDLLDHPVGKIILLGIAAQIEERQDRDRRLIWN